MFFLTGLSFCGSTVIKLCIMNTPSNLLSLDVDLLQWQIKKWTWSKPFHVKFFCKSFFQRRHLSLQSDFPSGLWVKHRCTSLSCDMHILIWGSWVEQDMTCWALLLMSSLLCVALSFATQWADHGPKHRVWNVFVGQNVVVSADGLFRRHLQMQCHKAKANVHRGLSLSSCCMFWLSPCC